MGDKIRALLSKQSWFLHAIFAFIVGLVALLLAERYGWFDHSEQRLYDIGLNLKDPPIDEAQCVIIAIDDATIEQWSGRPFPISLHLIEHARLVKALDSAGAKVICFDVLFDRLDSAKSEDISFFANVCKKAGNVLLASAVEDTFDLQGDHFASAYLALPCPTLYGSVAGVGLADVPVDFDGKIRRVAKVTRFQDSLLLSLSAQAAILYGQNKFNDVSENITYLIDYSWLSKIQLISGKDFIDHEETRESVHGKIAMIGVTSDKANDSYHVSLNSALGKPLMVPGVMVHAVAVQSLLSRNRIEPAHSSANLLLFVMVVVPFVFLGKAGRTWIAVAGYIAVALVFVIISVLAVSYASLLLPVIKLLFSLALVVGVQLILGITLLRRETASQLAVITEFSEDMQSAKVIQQHLQPRIVPTHPSFEFAAFQLTCKEVGGDYYDFIELEKGRIGILIGDVSGKVVSASLIVSNVQAVFRKEALPQHSPSAVLRAINAHLGSLSNASGRFISLFYGILDSNTLRLTCSNGGHCRPIVCSANGNSYELAEGGLFVGPFPDMEWVNTNAQLSRGDLVCFYTDGVSEAYDGKNLEQFGEERILNFLKQTSGTSEGILDALFRTCQSFAGNHAFSDDWTAIILKLK